ncbi:MAG: hypothetical protein KQH67_09295 [Bacteroidetes bacterium]|nr:hypothetical protein [Bacteroidota bacterium]
MKLTANILTLLVILLVASHTKAQNTGYGFIINSKFKIPQTGKKLVVFPLLNKNQNEKGNLTPKPFGVSVHSFYYNQDYYGTELQMVGEGKGTNEPIPVTIYVDSMYQNTSVMELKTQIRPNIWLFPFLNIYGIIGYTAGQVNPNITVTQFHVEIVNEADTIYQAFDTSFSITEKPVFHGPSFGVGATLSLGFSRFFLLVDYNFVMSNPLQVDGKLRSHLIAPKAGILFGNKKGQMKSALWIGAMGFYNNQFFSGELDVRDIFRELENWTGRYIDYRGDVKAYEGQQWNFIFGGSWMFNDYNKLSFEVGVYPRMQATLSYNRSF